MARRRKDDDWIWLVTQLSGALVLLSLISPQTQEAICAIGVGGACALGIAAAGLIGFGIYRFVTGSQRAERVERSVDWKGSGVDVKGEQRQGPSSLQRP
jgi:hypothetical protein